MSRRESKSQRTSSLPLGCGVLFLLAGLAFVGFFIWMASGAFASLTWKETVCRIVQSEIDETDLSKPKLKLKYSYVWEGTSLQSTRVYSVWSDSTDYGSLAKLVAKYPEGSETICYVNPKGPAEAVLQKRFEPLTALFLVIPLGIVGVTTTAVFSIWKTNRNPSTSISQGKPKEFKAVGMIFFGMFGLAGLLFMTPFYQAISGILRSANWTQLPCRVLYSGVQSDGDTYRLDILYSYQYHGKEFKSNRYGFSKISTSGRSGKASIVSSYPVGSSATCFVNPDDPYEAVLTRKLTGDMFFALIPLVFVVIGFVGLFVSMRSKKQVKEKPGTSSATFTSTSWPVENRKPMEGWVPLKNASPRVGSVIAALCICLFWNGIVSVFIFQLIDGWRHGRKDWFLMIFLIPFVAVGGGMIFWLLKSIVRLFLALPEISILGGEIQTGSKAAIKWRVNGNKVPSRLRFLLKGREIAKERAGSSTTTHESCFYEQSIHEAIGTMETRGGETSVSLPHDLPPTFKAGMNEVVWTLKVRSDKEGMLGLNEEFLIEVVPGKSPLSQGNGVEAESAGLNSVLKEKAGLQLSLDKQTFLPGDTIKLIAHWNVPKLRDSIQVRLFYFTEGKGDKDVQVIEERILTRKDTVGEAEIKFTLPRAPSSMHGKFVSVLWAIELMHTGSDEVIHVPIIVSASGKPITLNVVEPEMTRGKKKFGVWRRTR